MAGNAAAENVIRNLSGYTVLTVLRTAIVTGGERFAFGVGSTILFRTGQQDSRPLIGGRRIYGDTLESITDSAGTVSAGSAFIQSAVVNHSTQSLTGLRNGAVFATDATFMAAGAVENNAAATSVGTQGGGTYGFWNGDIAEIIVYNSAISTADRARVEAYLAAKWGISGVHAQATATSDPVGYWGDKSGNARHATQSTAGYRGVVGTQGTRRAITLDGTDDHLLLGNLSAAFPTAGEVVTAYALNAVDSAYTVYQTSDNSNSDVFGSLTFAGAFRNTRLQGLTFTGPSSIGTHLWGVSSQSSGYNLWVEGSQAFTTTSDHTGGTNHAIGMRSASPGANQAINGKLLEVCAFNRVLSTAERGRLNLYFAAKWGITLAPTVSNADAQGWVNRVYANGGTVSASTAAAVNTFCDAIDAAGIRSLMYRANLFCGTGLNACLVPLYRGPSLGGTQYGGTTDTNVGPFVSGDYAETTGLAAGSGKYLRTGLTQANVGVASHLAFYDCVKATNAYANRIGSRGAGDTHEHAITNLDVATSMDYASSATAGTGRARTTGYTQAGAFWLGVNPSATSAILYRNGVSAATSTPSARTAQNLEYWAFALNNNGTLDSNQTTGRSGGYSIGTAMDATQVAAYYTAMQAFQAALGRNV
jgi:hypothetical protein